ncbi:aldehyde dehydrogenase [Nocardia abscessus]|nr:aldehyde dehydrogenase [Nocardia abscessus]
MTTQPDVAPSVTEYDDAFIAGHWTPATGEAVLSVVNPATEQVIATVREASSADVRAAVDAARAAFDDGPWAQTTPDDRAAVLDAIADALDKRAEQVTALQTAEVGAPTAFSQASHGRAVGCLRYYAQQAREFPFRTDRPRADGKITRILQQPVGVVAAIAPWNGPLAVACLKMGPALAAGCTVVLKPAPETPLTAMVLADIIAELVDAGQMPAGVVNVINGGREIGAELVANPGVDKISFTGSTAAGSRIMASVADRIGRVTLELGGKSAAIILDDADLDQVLPSLIPGSCGNTGQMCFALTRVLVSERRHDEIVAAIADGMERLSVGDPTAPGTFMGPLAMQRQRERVEEYFELARSEGARVVTGGKRPAGLDVGYYIEPTLLTDVGSDSRIAQEEIFGPVLSVITYRDIDDAIRIANNSDYGLSGAIYTADIESGYAIAQRIRTGTISVNGSVFDTTVPFGGFKKSGIGREGGPEGMHPFLETKSVHMPD